MVNTSIDRRKIASLIWLAALLGSGGAAGLWLEFAQGWVQALLAAALLALTAILGVVWLAHDRAARRMNALDRYAEREIARARRRKVSHAAV